MMWAALMFAGGAVGATVGFIIGVELTNRRWQDEIRDRFDVDHPSVTHQRKLWVVEDDR